jgi:hypothetical protein
LVFDFDFAMVKATASRNKLLERRFVDLLALVKAIARRVLPSRLELTASPDRSVRRPWRTSSTPISRQKSRDAVRLLDANDGRGKTVAITAESAAN